METTVRFDADGYVDTAWALEAARLISDKVAGSNVDEIVDWLREGDFREGETVDVDRLMTQWSEYQAEAE